ncbi:sialate O-acetylesterase [Winogradskyella flava]|uniref:sialate O-acetylesterase n=1 Tax=Winogradskyella flava TaxID=1884876 RepID=UPI0024906F8A|nr:sialate O-acetylesterase [Winogradskyella flava]
MNLRFFLLLFFLCSALLNAQIELPSFFGDNMVLQQKGQVPIWGKDVPGTTIRINSSWGKSVTVVVDKNGFWYAKIKTKTASFNKETLEIIGSTTVKIKNILIGEVWFCSGQSNMEMPMKGLGKSKVLNAEEYLDNSTNEFIRLFNNQRTASVSPSFDVNGEWEVSNKASAHSFSAIGYIFGVKLLEQLNVPIGIIESAWGGTRIECWMPKEKLLEYEDVKFSKTLPVEQNKQKKPSFLYNAMIYPFKDFKIKGFLWYQGESNRTNPLPYKSYMKDLISSWRHQWKDNKLPFYFVQIAPFDYAIHKNAPGMGANLIREAQLKISQEISNTGMVVSTDAGDCNDIHPSKKEIVAKRLANMALTNQYKLKDLKYRSPEFRSMTVEKNKSVVLSFNFYDNDIFIENKNIKGFEVAGSDNIFYEARAMTGKNNKKIILHSQNVAKPIAVRYGFEDCFENNLMTKSGWPVSVFRTDDW